MGLCPLKTTFHSYSMKHGSCGFSNLGATCYFNSALVFIQASHALNKYVLNLEEKKESKQYEFIENLKSFYIQINEHRNIINPVKLIKSLSLLQPKFDTDKQSDMYECLIYMLTYIHQYANPSANTLSFDYNQVTQEDGSENEALYYMIQNSSSEVFDLYSLISKYDAYCNNCKVKKRKYESDFGIKLTLSSPSLSLVEEIGRQKSYLSFTAFKCLNCSNGVVSTSYSVVSYPPILLIYWQLKGENSPKYDQALILDGYTYTLSAVCCHSGDHKHGHYYSVIRNSEGTYNIVDDEYVEETTRLYRNDALALLFTNNALLADCNSSMFSLDKRLHLQFK